VRLIARFRAIRTAWGRKEGSVSEHVEETSVPTPEAPAEPEQEEDAGDAGDESADEDT